MLFLPADKITFQKGYLTKQVVFSEYITIPQLPLPQSFRTGEYMS